MILCSQCCVQLESCAVLGGRTKMPCGAISGRFFLSGGNSAPACCCSIPSIMPRAFEFGFTNRTALNFAILVPTNVTLASTNWTNLGPAASLGGGLYRFTDAGATGQPQRFFLLREQYHAASLAPAGRNVYSHGITKPEAPAERHRKEYVAPLGLFIVWGRWL